MFQKIHKQIYKIETIFPLVNMDQQGRIQLDGDFVRINSMRLQTFKYKGTKCVSCSLEGSFFRKEKDKQSKHDVSRRYHLNLYAVNAYGEPVLMTMDHVYPQCYGGTTSLDNLQTMCAPCNNKKDCKIT